MRLPSLLLFVGSLTIAHPTYARHLAQTAISVCAASKYFNVHSKTNIILNGILVSSHIHGSTIIDKNCPKIFIDPYENRQTLRDHEYRKLNDFVDPLSLDLVRIQVVIYGRLKHDKEGRLAIDVIRYLKSTRLASEDSKLGGGGIVKVPRPSRSPSPA